MLWHSGFLLRSLFCRSVSSLKHVPQQPVWDPETERRANRIELSRSTINLLEQLALMNLRDPKLLEELGDAIHLASRLDFVDTENFEPLYCLPNKGNHLRSDKVIETVPVRDILKTAEKTIDGLYCASTSKMI